MSDQEKQQPINENQPEINAEEPGEATELSSETEGLQEIHFQEGEVP